MKRLINNLLILVLILGSSLVLHARGQCLSNNDKLVGPVTTDLTDIQDFNVNLFKLVYPKDTVKNLVFSPYSVWNSLVIAYFGSAGETRKQFETILHVGDKIKTLKKWRKLEFEYLSRQQRSSNNTFVLSNRVYFDTSVRVRYCMEDILHNEISKLDMLKNPRSSADSINQFVSDTTRGNIKQLVSPLDIMFAHMVLVNAAYFKGTWKTQFDPESTREMNFHTFNSDAINVPMMTRDGTFRYGYDEENKYETLEIPYVGDTFSFYVFLPYSDAKEDFEKMVDGFTSESIDKAIEQMWETKTHVFIPKFKLDTLLEEDLIKAIFKMGLRDAFVESKANFTDFSFNTNLKLDRGIHKAFISLSEEGTEAGAATAFISNKIGGQSTFVCNRPFVFLIRDKKTKNILFIGAYKAPETKKSGSTTPAAATRPVNLVQNLRTIKG